MQKSLKRFMKEKMLTNKTVPVPDCIGITRLDEFVAERAAKCCGKVAASADLEVIDLFQGVHKRAKEMTIVIVGDTPIKLWTPDLSPFNGHGRRVAIIIGKLGGVKLYINADMITRTGDHDMVLHDRDHPKWLHILKYD